MAGKLPGIECARRRRFGGSNGWSDSSLVINSAFGSTRCISFYRTHFTSTSFSQRNMANQSDQDEKLDGVARKAKERLDGRLRSHWISETNSPERSSGVTTIEESRGKTSPSTRVGDLQAGAVGSKKGGSKMCNWWKMGLSYKSSDQEECVVCLEKFKAGEKVDRLPCAHRFHSTCLLPWLEGHAHCPCCRMSLLGST
ncbi:hypothetical protein SSX86_021397 [Deinandra increscens subsp. villosa]|uniref:RING-type domain-containing protein n=1 Tax=Deinandra increscens subsp. villosa TaxID=3103831 RepID=A0AAP0GT28_9ASTR